jgi:hypothetical protein
MRLQVLEFFSIIFIIPFIFDENPDGTLILERTSKKDFLLCFGKSIAGRT